MAQSVPTSWEVKLGADFDAQDAMKRNGIHVYDTTSKNRGVALIINIDEEEEMVESFSSEGDSTQLQMVFEMMGFAVIVATSEELQTKEEIKGLLSKFVVYKKLKEVDITAVITIGSGCHGHGFFNAPNGEKIYYDEVKTYFSDINCPLMKDKPKIVLFQSSRNQDSNEKADKDLIRNLHPTASATSDLLVAWASSTEFLNKLCEEFMTNAYKHDICTMFDNVYRLLKNRPVENELGEYTKATFGLCFLNPGMYRDENGMKRSISNDQSIEDHANEVLKQAGLGKKYCRYHMREDLNVELAEGDCERYRRSLLLSAANHNHLECCVYLLAKGMKVNGTDNCGSTALHYAAFRGNLKLCQILIQAGANATVQNDFPNDTCLEDLFPKEIPLIHAFKSKNTECIDYLHGVTSLKVGYDLPKVQMV